MLYLCHCLTYATWPSNSRDVFVNEKLSFSWFWFLLSDHFHCRKRCVTKIWVVLPAPRWFGLRWHGLLLELLLLLSSNGLTIQRTLHFVCCTLNILTFWYLVYIVLLFGLEYFVFGSCGNLDDTVNHIYANLSFAPFTGCLFMLLKSILLLLLNQKLHQRILHNQMQQQLVQWNCKESFK